ncbi:receptor kinase 2 [Zostera marina]|uniref:Receptor kinase 2 n=1 Tax=Zostera marina TaxID=29655 RepID=A0A0K9P2I4_ZOSMR|nr:receptor kinase 2 [Zostera marina]
MSFFLQLLSSFIFLLPLSSLVAAYQYQTCDTSKSNYTANTTFDANLQLILQSLSSNTTTTGFFNDTKGLGSDRVYGLAMCRGDVSPADCRPCLNTSVEQIVQKCPNNKAAVIWEDECLVRYSDENFFGKVAKSTGFPYNVNNVTNTTLFNQKLEILLDEIIKRAAYGPRQLSYPLLFAVNETSYLPFQTIYGLVQCTRDLSEDDCNKCLIDQLQYIPKYLNGKIGARILSGSCFTRYESATFYKGSIPLQQAPPPDRGDEGASDTRKKKNSKTTIIAVAILVPIGGLTVLFLFCCFCRIKRKKTRNYEKASDSMEILDNESRIFDLATIKLVTDNFSEANKLGEGGFGSVYKGTLADGRYIAVKRLSSNSKQGIQEFKNEISLLIKLQHRNLVRILGFCLENDEKLLIYEYIHNKSLDTILKDPIKRQQLDWGQRYNIIGGIAKGLLYLHEESQVKIIHRDLKASNILLDSELNPKIADFGLARMFDIDQTKAVTDRIAGTFGYMAPEYVRRGHFSSKSDVYSFGILILELVSGRMNNNNDDDDDLLTYVWEHWRKKSISNIVDSTMGNNYPMNEASRCIEIGLLCLQEAPEDRITMSTALVMLSGYSATFNAPSKPAFLSKTVGDIPIDEGNSRSSGYSQSHILRDKDGNELSITDLTLR